MKQRLEGNSEAEYLSWLFGKKKKFILWVAAIATAFILYFTVHDITLSIVIPELHITLALRAIEIMLTVCVVLLVLRVKPVTAQRLLLPCMICITVAVVFDTYFWIKNINHVFNPTGQMFTIYIFMIIPFTSVLHKLILGAIFATGIYLCGYYLNLPLDFETSFYVLAIYISEVGVFYRFDTLLRGQFKAIEEKKKYTEQLEKSKSELQQALTAEREAIKQNLNFIDMISHEYRTPLSIITTSVDSLETLDIISESDEAATTLGVIREASRRLLSIYESSLHEKRINASGLMPYKKSTELLTVLELATDFVRYVYSEHSIFIEDNLTVDMLVEADKELLTTAFINLIDNACKYSPPSKILLTLNQEQDDCVIEIIDNGNGIDNSEIGVVFEKYYRCGTSKQKPGAGVGLYLVRKIIQLHNGSISLTSTLGVGTKITVILPLLKDINNE